MDEETAEKQCKDCQELKRVADFYRSPSAMPGHRPYCKACHKKRRRAAYLAGGGSDVPYAQLLKRKYGMTLEQYNEILRKQAHRCAICRQPETVRTKRTGEVRRLQVDHDHVTGAVRGLLCHRCNLVVWALEENHTLLAAISRYIEEFRETFADPSVE